MCEVGEGGQKVQTSNYRKITHGIIMCSMATVANNTILKNYFVYLKVAKRGDLKSPHHTHTRCNNVRWWAWDGLIMVMISQYIQILSHYVAHPKWIWRDMSTMHQLKKRKWWKDDMRSHICWERWSTELASGSAVSLPLRDVKDTYGLGRSDGIGLGLCISQKLPGNDNSCRSLAAFE